MIIFQNIRWKNFLSTGNQYTEINLSAVNDEEALKTFRSLDLNNFVWNRDQMLHRRTTYEVTKSDENSTDSTIVTKGRDISGK